MQACERTNLREELDEALLPFRLVRKRKGKPRDGWVRGIREAIGLPVEELERVYVKSYEQTKADPAWLDVSHIRDEALAWGRRYAILGGDWSPFWHDAIDLLGMEELMLRMYEEPEVVDALFTHLVDYYAASSERVFQAADSAIDIFFIGNDFGSQRGPLIGPPTFRRFFFPHLSGDGSVHELVTACASAAPPAGHSRQHPQSTHALTLVHAACVGADLGVSAPQKRVIRRGVD